MSCHAAAAAPAGARPEAHNSADDDDDNEAAGQDDEGEGAVEELLRDDDDGEGGEEADDLDQLREAVAEEVPSTATPTSKRKATSTASSTAPNAPKRHKPGSHIWEAWGCLCFATQCFATQDEFF